MPLSAGCRLLRPRTAGALEQADGVRATPFWRTVEDCLLRAPFSYGLAIAVLRCGQRAYRAMTFVSGFV